MKAVRTRVHRLDNSVAVSILGEDSKGDREFLPTFYLDGATAARTALNLHLCVGDIASHKPADSRFAPAQFEKPIGNTIIDSSRMASVERCEALEQALAELVEIASCQGEPGMWCEDDKAVYDRAAALVENVAINREEA